MGILYKIPVAKFQQGNVLTYKDNADWFNNRAVYNNDPAYNKQIREAVYSGKWGYNPTTKSLHKLGVTKRASVDPQTKKWAAQSKKEVTQDRAVQASHQEHINHPKATVEYKWWHDPNYKPTKAEMDDYVKMGHKASNDVFGYAASFTPVGMGLYGLESAASLPGHLMDGDYGAAGFNALGAFPLVSGPLLKKVEKIISKGAPADASFKAEINLTNRHKIGGLLYKPGGGRVATHQK